MWNRRTGARRVPAEMVEWHLVVISYRPSSPAGTCLCYRFYAAGRLMETPVPLTPILVTGATGLVGNNLVRTLVERGSPVRVLVREGSDPWTLEGLPVEAAYGDVRDAEAVRRASRGVAGVIHAAALVHIGRTRLEEQRRVNVEGTRHVAEAALAAGVRMVHVSSVDALGTKGRDEPADEDSPRVGVVSCGYTVTKREAEEVVQTYVARGLDAVIVNPGFMLGPWDWKPSSGRMLLQIACGFTPLAPAGGCSFCDVRDVAGGILAAMERGRRGRNYILAGHNMSYLDLWRLFAEVTGRRAPWFRAGPLLQILGGRFGDLWGRILGREGDLNSASVAMSSQYRYYTSARAESELGYRIRPAREPVEAAWQWFQQYGDVCSHGARPAARH